MPPRKQKALSPDCTLSDLMDTCYDDGVFNPPPPSVFIPSGLSIMDWAIGLNGWPCGRVIHLYGEESSCKSECGLRAIRNAILMGGCGLLIDAEHAFDWNRLPKIGFQNCVRNSEQQVVSCRNFTVKEPTTLEEVHKMIETAIEHSKHFPQPMVIVWDSYVSVGTRSAVKPAKGKEENNSIALEPRLNSAWFRKRVLRMLSDSQVCLIIVNQIRDVPNAWNPERKQLPPGGRALKHAASLAIEFSVSGRIKPANEHGNIPGIYVNAEVKKNKFAPSRRSANYAVYFEHAVDDIQCVIRYAAQKGLIDVTSTGRVVYDGKAMLKRDLWQHLYAHEKEFEALKEKCRAEYVQIDTLGTAVDISSGDDDE